MLSEYTREIQELKRQLVDGQQQLRAAEKQRSTATQDGHLEAAELKLLLVEKNSLIKVSSSLRQLLEVKCTTGYEYILGFYYDRSQS
jgi:hypothetical protein